ncbi:MAG: alpha/beta fold hydrolase [Luteitalea sp.]|nr:alpha/beta fold hydrolase [Luteitalea sp.]
MREPKGLTIQLESGATVSARHYTSSAASSLGSTLILAHGAGAGQTHPWMVARASALAARGLDVVTFNFPYMERRRRAPDSAAVLIACYAAVLTKVAAGTDGRVLVGGKSMGGRIATELGAARPDENRLSGIVLLGYPLHPPGRPQQLRSAHLPSVRRPMLFVQGTRDSFGTPSELQAELDRLAVSTTIHAVDDGDHSLIVKRGGRPQELVFDEVYEVILRWIAAL